MTTPEGGPAYLAGPSLCLPVSGKVCEPERVVLISRRELQPRPRGGAFLRRDYPQAAGSYCRRYD